MTGTGHVDVESRAHARELVRGDRSIRGLAAGPDHVVPAAPVVVAEHEKIDRISVGAETSTTAGGCNIDDVGEAEDAAAAIVVAGFKIDGFDVRDLWCAEVQIAGIGIEQRVEAGGAVDGVPEVPLQRIVAAFAVQRIVAPAADESVVAVPSRRTLPSRR